jgi:hypothetical protein
MPLELGVYNRYRFIFLMLMLAPYGAVGALSADAAATAKPPDQRHVIKLNDLYTSDAVPHLHAGGTIMLQQPVIQIDPSPRIR